MQFFWLNKKIPNLPTTKNLYKNTVLLPASLVPSEIMWISSLDGDKPSAETAKISGKFSSDCGDIGGIMCASDVTLQVC